MAAGPRASVSVSFRVDKLFLFNHLSEKQIPFDVSEQVQYVIYLFVDMNPLNFFPVGVLNAFVLDSPCFFAFPTFPFLPLFLAVWHSASS